MRTHSKSRTCCAWAVGPLRQRDYVCFFGGELKADENWPIEIEIGVLLYGATGDSSVAASETHALHMI